MAKTEPKIEFENSVLFCFKTKNLNFYIIIFKGGYWFGLWVKFLVIAECIFAIWRREMYSRINVIPCPNIGHLITMTQNG